MLRFLSISSAVLAAALTLSACSQMPAAGSSPGAATLTQQEANRRIVLDFYNKAFNQKDVDAAMRHLGERYVQHNPVAEDGREGFRKFVAFMKGTFPQSRADIKRSFAQGDYVILHVHSVREPGTRGNAIVDIFKLENGKIVEHWDAIQPIPEKSANGNTMF